MRGFRAALGLVLGLGVVLVSILGTPTAEAGASRLYDMTRLLNEPHPFARDLRPMPPLAAPAYVPAPVPRPPLTPMAAPAAPALGAPPAPAARETPAAKEGPWLISELRVGILKHSVSFGSDAKESGFDGNIEILFVSPDWWLMEAIFAPRPHLGASFNAAAADTDQIYAGLTWEWPRSGPFFMDLGLGLTIHNGMLDNSMITGKARDDRREFGCRVVFRQALDVGWRITKNHSLSVMLSHLSHAGLCGGENEGLNNAGVRYGYRF